MPYLGKTPSQATRKRYYKTASAGDTSVSGTMTVGGTLTFTDGEFVDVSVNGVALVAGTDYNTNTANTIAGLSALAANDQVEIVVYDTFSVFSGDVDSNLSVGGNLSVTGTSTLTGNVSLPDNTSLIFGAGTDLTINHDGSNSFITDSGTGALYIQGTNGVFIRSADGGENLASFTDDGSVALNHDNTTRIETTSSGVDITGGFTATDGCTITTADNDAQLTLTSTDADAAVGPLLDMIRDSSSPADSDTLGRIRFRGDNDAGEVFTYGTITSKITDASDSTEGGLLTFLVARNGSVTSALDLNETETVFNEGSLDADFRVESNGNANMLFVDGGNDKVAIGTGTAVGTLTTECTAGDSNFALTAYHPTSTSARNIAKFQSNVGSTQADVVTIGCDGGIEAIGEITTTNSLSQNSNSIRTAIGNDGGSATFGTSTNHQIKLFTNNTQIGLFDTDGNFLVAGTSTTPGLGNTTTGLALRADGIVSFSGASNYFNINRNGTGTIQQFNSSGNTKGSVTIASGGVTYATTSDIRLKQDIEPLDATDKLMAMNPVSYNWKADPDGPRSMGFIAQEMEEIMPEAVNTGNDKMMQMDYGRITPILVSALQDAHKKIEQLESRIAMMESK